MSNISALTTNYKKKTKTKEATKIDINKQIKKNEMMFKNTILTTFNDTSIQSLFIIDDERWSAWKECYKLKNGATNYSVYMHVRSICQLCINDKILQTASEILSLEEKVRWKKAKFDSSF